MNHLAFLFYVFALIELILAGFIFFIRVKTIRIVVDVILALYLLSLIAYYAWLLKISGNCIECNYTTHILGENLKTTIGLLFGLSLVYFLVIRNYHLSKGQGNSPKQLQLNRVSHHNLTFLIFSSGSCAKFVCSRRRSATPLSTCGEGPGERPNSILCPANKKYLTT